MKLTSLFLATASASIAPFSDSIYPNGHPTTDWGPTSATCPVKCMYDGNKIKVEHMLEHAKMDPWVGSQPGGIVPNSAQNKVFHRCFHRISATSGPFGTTNGKDATSDRECQCECAQWSQETCSVANDCPTQQCQSASTLTGTKATSCKFHNRVLRPNQCLAGDKPDESCTVECPATVSEEVIQKWTGFNDGTAKGCERTNTRLQEKRGDDCEWISSRKAVDKNTFESFDVEFALKGNGGLDKRGGMVDHAKVYIRTCSNSNCGSWILAKQHKGNTRRNRFQAFNVNVDHSQILRTGDKEVQAKVKLHNDGESRWWNREMHELDNLKITASCD